MITRAIATLVAPARSITFGAVQNMVLLESRDFAATVVAARTESGSQVEVEHMSWTFSKPLGGPYSYLTATTTATHTSFTRELKFTEPVLEVVMDLVPWSASSKNSWASLRWTAVRFTAVSVHGNLGTTLTGLAELEVRQ